MSRRGVEGISLLKICDTPRREQNVPRLTKTVQMVGYEERRRKVRGTMFDFPAGKSGSRKGKRIVTTLRSSRLEVGPHHNGPCMRTTQDTRRTRHYMGSSRPIDQSSTFHSHSVKLSDQQTERLVHLRSSTATWSPLIY